MNDTIILKGKIKHGGYGFEITPSGDVQMRVTPLDLQHGDTVVSTNFEFGVLASLIVIRPFDLVEIIPICLAAEA